MQYIVLFILSVIFYYVFCFKKYKAEDLYKKELECNAEKKEFSLEKENFKINFNLCLEFILSSIMLVLCYFAFMNI